MLESYEPTGSNRHVSRIPGGQARVGRRATSRARRQIMGCSRERHAAVAWHASGAVPFVWELYVLIVNYSSPLYLSIVSSAILCATAMRVGTAGEECLRSAPSKPKLHG